MRTYSIVLPVRNGGGFFKDCVQSILMQNYSGFNLIVLDNHSSDGTPEWIESLQHNKIILHRSNDSLTIEENWARIKQVKKNEYMTMIGHDDLLHSDYLVEVNKLIESHPDASLYQTHFNFIDENGDFLRKCLPMIERQKAAGFLSAQMMRVIDSTGTGYMMRSRDFDEIGGMPIQYPNLIFSDFHLWISLMMRGYKATSQSECFSYRIHQSVSRVTNGMAYQQAFFKYLDFLTLLAEQEQEIKNAIELHGKEFLLYYTEALAHRLLKTPIGQRSLKVSDLIAKCKLTASRFIPGQEFKPESKLKIRLAELLDESVGRNLFQFFRKIK